MKSLDTNGMLAQYCCSIGAGVAKSTIDHKKAAIGCYARIQSGKKMMTRHFHGTLLHINLYNSKNLDRMYKQEMMSVSLFEVQIQALHIRDDVEDGDGIICVVKFLHCSVYLYLSMKLCNT